MNFAVIKDICFYIKNNTTNCYFAHFCVIFFYVF